MTRGALARGGGLGQACLMANDPRRMPAGQLIGVVGARCILRVALVAWALTGTACRDRAAAPAASSASTAGAAREEAEPEPAAGTSPRRSDPRWRSALEGDEARAAELGADLGVADLSAALRDERAVRATAIRALPFSGDRDASLGALAAALSHHRGDESAVADAIERTLAVSRRDVEVTSRDGAAACGAALEGIAAGGGRGDLGPERAASLARRIGE